METHHPSRILLWLLGGLVVGLTALMVTVAISNNQPAPTPTTPSSTERLPSSASKTDETTATSAEIDALETETSHDLDDLDQTLKDIEALDVSLDNVPEL